MILKKNKSVFYILIITILILYFMYNTFANSDKKSVKSVSSVATVMDTNVNEKTEVSPKKINVNIQENKSDSVSTISQTNDDIPENVTEFFKALAQQKDSIIVLKIDDLPSEQQVPIEKWLLSYQIKGYIDSSDVALDHMELQNAQAGFLDLSSPSITFPLQDIKNTKLSTYEYKGAIFDQADGAENLPISGVKRLYVDNNGREISLYEKSLAGSSSSIVIKEFVSDDIKGYPGVRMTYCTESKRCTSEITFVTKDKSYEIMMKGDKESTKEQLIEIALSLDLPEIKK